MRGTAFVAAGAAALIAATIAVAGGVVFDTTFDGDGIVVTDFAGADSASGLLVLADGKLLVSGAAIHTGGGWDAALARYNGDGSLDTSFGVAGKATADVGFHEPAGGPARQSDGKLLVGGWHTPNATTLPDFAATRFLADGTLDTSFGTGGLATADLGGVDFGRVLALQADGGVVVAGETDGNAAVVRFDPGGALDPTFGGGDGMVITDLGGVERPFAAALQSDGKIVLAGNAAPTSAPSAAELLVMRYLSNGDLDTTFGSGGAVTTTVPGAVFALARAVAVQSDGKIVIGGWAAGASTDFVVARYTSTGALDSTFGSGGITTTDFGGTDSGSALSIDSAGRIVMFGHGDGEWQLARYLTDGTLDPSFDGDGKLVSDLGGIDIAFGVTHQPDGKIVGVGRTGPTHAQSDFAVARYVVSTNRPPSCGTASAAPASLWPPNHKLVPVGITVSDPDGDAVATTVTAVEQDEPVNGPGDGDTTPDAVVDGGSLKLRAERAGKGDGRVYHVSFTATDTGGATCSGTLTVAVPHSPNKPAGDGGALHDSFG